MKNNIHIKIILSVLLIAAMFIAIGRNGNSLAAKSFENIIPTVVAQEVVEPAKIEDLRPVNIVIPTARVNADVINVGVTETNNLDVPPNFVQTGWYKYGPLPGQPGNAVIDGHVDNGGSIDGVFKYLKNVRAGDKITITLSDGTEVRYMVTGLEVVKTTEFPGESVFLGGDDAVLKIITCHGTFVPSMDTYDQRLIVTAILVQ